jgi:hypothetical protein
VVVVGAGVVVVVVGAGVVVVVVGAGVVVVVVGAGVVVVVVVDSRVQSSLPSGANVPAGQGWQTFDTAPTAVENCPSLQLKHAVSPVMFL